MLTRLNTRARTVEPSSLESTDNAHRVESYACRKVKQKRILSNFISHGGVLRKIDTELPVSEFMAQQTDFIEGLQDQKQMLAHPSSLIPMEDDVLTEVETQLSSEHCHEKMQIVMAEKASLEKGEKLSSTDHKDIEGANLR